MTASLAQADNSVSDGNCVISTSLETFKPNSISPHEEFQYLDLIRSILTEGEHRPDR